MNAVSTKSDEKITIQNVTNGAGKTTIATIPSTFDANRNAKIAQRF
jgi:hypothetical protein